MALGVLCLSLLVISIDNSILNVALPTLVRDLGATPSQLQWIVDAYILVFAGLLLTAGSLGDRFGRKRVLTAGLVIFGVASGLAALSQTPLQLMLARGCLGVGAALIMPATLSIVVDVFPDPGERRRAIAYWSLMNAAGAFVGPVTGGTLLRYFDWNSIFLVNIPVVLIALALGHFFLPRSRDPESARFDILGAVMSTAALALVLWTIIEGPSYGWLTGSTLGPAAVAVVLGIAFVLWEGRAAEPMLDLSLFKNPQLSAAALAMTVAFMAITGTMFLVTQGLQLVKGYSPLGAAIAVSGPLVIVNFLVMPRTPAVTERVGARWMVTAGASCVALASLVLGVFTTVDSAYTSLFLGFALMALGFSTFVPASTEAIMTAVPPERSGNASALNQLTRQLGQALGIAISGSIAAQAYRSSFNDPPEASAAVAETAGNSITDAIEVSRGLADSAAEALLDAAGQAFLVGVRISSIIAAVLAVMAAFYAAWAIPGSAGRDVAEKL